MNGSSKRLSLRAPWLAGLFAGLALFVFIALPLTGIGLAKPYELWRHSRTTSATITQLEPDDHDGCVFAFSASGTAYSVQDEGCGTDHSVGDRLAVLYDPGDPADASATNRATTLIDFLMVNFGIPILIGLVVGVSTHSPTGDENAERTSRPDLPPSARCHVALVRSISDPVRC